MFTILQEIEDRQSINKLIKSNSSVSINWLGYIGLKLMKVTGEFYGADWQSHVNSLSFLQQGNELSNGLSDELAKIINPQITYPSYYFKNYHAYEAGNLCWQAATEVELVYYTIHCFQGFLKPRYFQRDKSEIVLERLYQSHFFQEYHQIIKDQLKEAPRDILDLACGVGINALLLKSSLPQAQVSGLDISPYSLAVAYHRAKQHNIKINWIHSNAESTNLPNNSFDLINATFLFHELPHATTVKILSECLRLLRPNGSLIILDVNAALYAQKLRSLLPKSKFDEGLRFLSHMVAEPYLSEYFTFDFEKSMSELGFTQLRKHYMNSRFGLQPHYQILIAKPK
ncbi:MAG: class I SAM-dependent methyltransferase [Gammaproteobacteria bacterium]|nr:class I SAM-dependent methyltransferase [Gammaproteobacteria bacterium]